MASKSAIFRLIPLVKPKLSAAHATRLDQILKLIDPDGRAVLAKVLKALYPRQDHDTALAAFRQFRRALGLAAEEAGVRLSLETDGQTRSAPAKRVVWFEGEDRVAEEVKRLVEAEIGDVERLPQDVKEDRPLRFFVSYASDDAKLKNSLLGKLQTLFRGHPSATFELWSDKEILPGKEWRAEIQKAMDACDFGLLLTSPAFFANKFITKKELPHLLHNKPVIPVALRRFPMDGTVDLKGLEERQIFRDSDNKAFSERITDNPRDAFVEQLHKAVCARLAERSSPAQPAPSPARPKYEDHARSAVDDFDEARFVHTEGVMTTLAKGLEAAPEIDPSRRKDAIEFLMEWIVDPQAPPYCALLGEYGMGKTTTCKALARDLLRRREQGEKVPLPIYLDLRHVGESARRELVLPEIVDLILKRSWKTGPEGAGLSAQDLIGLVANEGALVIWDGLDEVLVHLDANPGQMFTRQLFRILPPARKGEQRRGRMLISCRTHYFRTLRDQQTHFRAEDRDNVRQEDYRPPFVLLPFTPKQIREYLAHTLPDENPDRVLEVLKSVHNLGEMAERPYTLSLIAEQFAQIEQWKAEGRRVTGLMLYRHMVLSWLERDEGKHQLTRDHKQALMEHFAAELWRAGERFWSVAQLEQWLVDFLEARPHLAAHYKTKDRELLKEDLRTATFLVREGEDQFRFAHTSLQEYFLAGYLRRALVEGRPEDWDLPRVSPETLDFLGQWLAEEAGRSAALTSLSRLRDTYRARASELAFAFSLLAVSKGYPAPSAAGFQLPGADLSDWEIQGSPGAPLMLAAINLRGARLWNSRWRYCNLEGAVFDGADALRAEWLDCHLANSAWRIAALEATVFRDCDFTGAEFEGAQCRQTQWLRCGLSSTRHLPAGRPEALYALCGNPETAHPARVAVATGHSGPVNACAWSPDGRRIVSASEDQTLRLWDASSGACLATLSGHEGAVQCCVWSPDGGRIVSAAHDATLRLWGTRHPAPVSPPCPATGVADRGCAWSPDGHRIVSASYDQTLRLWNALSGDCLATLSGHNRTVNDCAWSPDGRRIVSASFDQTLRLWDGASGACLATLSGHVNGVLGCAWSPDGRRIVSASSDHTLRLWDAASGAYLATLSGHESAVVRCAWSPDGRRIVSASPDHSLCLWDSESGACLATLSGHENAVVGCAWSPDGRRIVSASNDRTLRLWDALSSACVATLSGPENSVVSCAWSPDGRRIVSASNDRTLRLWDAPAGVCLATLSGHLSWVRGCAWSPDGRRIVSASNDQTMRLWDAESGACLTTMSGHEHLVLGCAWSPDGRRVVSGSADNTLRLWDAYSGTRLVTLSGHEDLVLGCAWSPDGRCIASVSSDKTLRLWDATSGACLATLSGHKGLVLGCAWSPDGPRIVSASSDETLRLWDAESGACLTTMSGHEDGVWGCAWSPDGRRIVSASDDQTLRLWDAAWGDCLATLSGHEGRVRGCAWSPDGRRIVSASSDGTLRTWDAATGLELAPRIYAHLTSRGQSTWCTIDHPANRIVACHPEAWRVLGWIAPSPVDGLPDWLPAETFGPLPTSIKVQS